MPQEWDWGDPTDLSKFGDLNRLGRLAI